jgi:hypothetical protein
MNAPAKRMEVPTDVDSATYANANLTEAFRVFEQYGIRFLTADEMRTRCLDTRSRHQPVQGHAGVAAGQAEFITRRLLNSYRFMRFVGVTPTQCRTPSRIA